MRGVWWSAFALLLVAVVVGALRTAQVEGVSRVSRRHPSLIKNSTTIESENTSPSLRTRTSRRREETTPRDISRTRSRSRSSDVTTSTTETLQFQSERNERFDSKRQNSRTRGRQTIINEENFDTTINRDTQSRSRSRQVTRRLTSQSTTTSAPMPISSPTTSRKEFTESAFNDISKTVTKEVADPNSQFKRRSSTERVIEPTTTRTRNRINTRTNIRTLDLEVSGTANALTTAFKEPTTAQMSDLRNSRKLRYKSRQSEVDSNLTGEGLSVPNEVKSSQIEENITSQIGSKSVLPSTTETIVKQTTERLSKTSTIKTTKVVKRPIPRGKVKAPILTAKPKVSDEVHEDDNYPETFKALIQAKNASTQASSPPSESLSVKASQKVYNTYNTSSQSILTAPDTEKQFRLRSKINLGENKNESRINDTQQEETTPAPKQFKPKSSEYRLRGSYIPRSKKSSTFSSSTDSLTAFSPVTQRSYKFSRKQKIGTTESINVDNSVKSIRVENSNNNNNLFKKPVIRSSLYTRRNLTRNFSVNSEGPKRVEIDRSDKTFTLKPKPILSKTSYYSRVRSNLINKTLGTNSSAQSTTEEILTVGKKTEDTAELPLIYTNSATTAKNSNKDNEFKNDNQNFVITVNSKESAENGTLIDVVDKIEENKPPLNVISTTQKYHATYKDNSNDISLQNREKVTAVPSIRNIQTRKYGRKTSSRKEDVSSVTTKSIVKSSRKYGDTFSKTTEPSSNGIIGEPEKIKNKFSSKYRSSYLDKPFYKPTVPTITPTTAWLKFFVTDHLLSKSVEEPNWFEDEDFSDVTTEQTSRQNDSSPTCMHETAFPPVEGEEIQLGPDMNAISITKSRSPLTSADLRLSESLAKSLQVMNVEASHHSPSVTVSIFDALAEILTSTPKPRISSTTEVLQSQNSNNDVKQTLAGVSNNINVNSVKDLTSQDNFMPTDVVATDVKTVQTTGQSRSHVFNRMPVEGYITPSPIIEAGITSTVNTLSTFPLPTSPPSTPVSVRRPFAIKVLYADTERTTDRTTIVTTTDQSTTDTSTRVYNTVSDLILSNNKIVSTELTSMLSNNIKNIIENMDEDSKARLSVDMVKLLNKLIPKLSKPITVQDDVETVPNTTPYSLEDIKDTENIYINNQENSYILTDNILQNVIDTNIVNSTKRNIETEVTTSNPTEIVNSTVALNKLDNTTTSALGALSISVTSKNYELNIAQSTEASSINLSTPQDNISTITLPEIDIGLSSPGADVVIVNSDSGLNSNNVTNNPPLVPFLTNFELNDFNDSESLTLGQILPIAPMTSLQVKELEDIENIQDPSQLSRLQLWILSKKARVLKMIEDIIKNHNEEISNAPLTELVNNTNQNNVFLSSRLSDIVNTMNMTTENITSNQNTLNMPTSTPVTITESTTSPTNPSTSFQANIYLSISKKTFSTTQTDVPMTTTLIPLETASDILTSTELPAPAASQFTNDGADAFSATTVGSTTINDDESVLESTRKTTDADLVQSTTISSNAKTTTSFDSELMTESGTSENFIASTTIASIDTTMPLKSDASSNINTNIRNKTKIITTSTNPKKDYVIFGILPNNTVVRKDPNDNVLETLTEASPYIIYGVLPNNTIIRKFPNGTRVPRIMQKIDILPISPWSLRNPYSPIHNIPAIVRPQSNPIRVSTNTVTSNDTSNNGTENQLTTDTVNNLQTTISSSALNIKDSSSFGITTSTNKPPAEKSTASHVLSLRTTTMLPSIDEILLNSISSATKEEMVISSMTSSTSEPRILTLDIDPETKQIRTEKPVDGNGNAVFKFIPIDEVTVSPQESNVLRLASTKMPKTATIKETQTTISEPNTQLPIEITSEASSSPSDMPILVNTETTTTVPQSPLSFTTTVAPMITETVTTSTPMMVTQMTPTIGNSKPTTSTLIPIATTQMVSTTVSTEPSTVITTSTLSSSSTETILPVQSSTSSNIFETAASNQKDAELLQSLIQEIGRTPKNLNIKSQNIEQNDSAKILQAILAGGGRNLENLIKRPQTTTTTTTTTTVRSIEDDIRQFEEDTKLLKALLLATGRNPEELNLPSLDIIRRVTSNSATTVTPSTTTAIISSTPPTTLPTTTIITTTPTTTTTAPTTTTTAPTTTTPTTTTTPATTPTTITSTTTSSTITTSQAEKTTSSLNDDLRKLQEDTKLLQALLQATGNQNAGSLPIISGLTSNIRVASNPLTTSIESNPTTAFNLRPVYTTRPSPVFNSFTPGTVSVSTLQPQQSSTEDIRISTTYRPFTERSTTIQNIDSSTATTRRSKAARFRATTEIPSTSTFSDEEDLLFLQNLKSVLSSKTNGQDSETALANRVIALAVERSLNEIQGSKLEVSSTMIPTTTKRPTTTTRPITTTRQTTTTRPTTTRPTTMTSRLITTASTPNTPSIEDDIKQFEEDTKLLQALLKATGQDPSKFNIPTLNTIRPAADQLHQNVAATTAKPYSAKIAVKDDLSNEQDDAKLLQTLIKLQDAQETTTQRGKITFTGQSSDEALKKLLQQAQPTGMVSEATKSSISLSTEYGNSNDALLAALLKEQGFGPTTASSIDEQLRLAALLNQVVVTPKARRTTTPPPPPAPRRPLLDGLAWLWQQWRETAPDPGQPRPNRRPEQPRPSNSPAAATSSRVNWFGSGPFVGNADERPTSNRIPLEPPSAVTSEQGPGRGQLVSAAINVTRAFSQFLGAAIQGAAQTVQSVIRAGQRVATDAYTGGSG